MGMFDTIYIHKELPFNKKQKEIFSHIDWNDQPFQTKDLDNSLAVYTLKKNGKLYTTRIEGDHVRIMTEAEEKKERKKNRWVWPYEFKETSRKEIIVKHTGNICFYDMLVDKNGNEWWVDFEAKIVDGSLKGKFQIIKCEINRTKQEIDEDEAHWKKLAEDHNKKISTKIRKFLNRITFSHWYSFWNGVSKVLRNTAQELSNFGFWIIRNIS
jgi:hypothetical protein